jgi:hypothetical protein
VCCVCKSDSANAQQMHRHKSKRNSQSASTVHPSTPHHTSSTRLGCELASPPLILSITAIHSNVVVWGTPRVGHSSNLSSSAGYIWLGKSAVRKRNRGLPFVRVLIIRARTGTAHTYKPDCRLFTEQYSHSAHKPDCETSSHSLSQRPALIRRIRTPSMQ